MDKDLRPILSLLSKASNLKSINLKKNKLTDRSIEQLCLSIKRLKIESLNLSFNRLSPGCFTYLRRLKMENRYLKAIWLKNNDIPSSIKKKKTLEFKKLGVVFDPRA